MIDLGILFLEQKQEGNQKLGWIFVQDKGFWQKWMKLIMDIKDMLLIEVEPVIFRNAIIQCNNSKNLAETRNN